MSNIKDIRVVQRVRNGSVLSKDESGKMVIVPGKELVGYRFQVKRDDLFAEWNDNGWQDIEVIEEEVEE
jgi:hypothetical protein